MTSQDRASALPREAPAGAHPSSRPAGAVPPQGETTNPLADTRCAVCGHIRVGHDLNKAGDRTACLTSEGPDGVRCGCKQYVPTPTT